MAAELRAPATGWLPASIASQFGARLNDQARADLGRWLDLVVAWNARMDLTAARSAEELLDLMLADALVLAERVPPGASVVDVGTGAGAPGLALAIVRPDLRVTLVEPLAKRASFLRTAVGTLERLDVRLVPQKGESLVGVGEPYDVAVSRATLPPPAWLALGLSLVRGGGSVWVLLAKEPAPENAEASAMDAVEYVWPLGRAARRAVRFEKRARLP